MLSVCHYPRPYGIWTRRQVHVANPPTLSRALDGKGHNIITILLTLVAMTGLGQTSVKTE
ncbi:MAG: hypothetical protein K5764_05455 [Prevotella sp.]|nr:hypothetical protein [Prevotella sp.]